MASKYLLQVIDRETGDVLQWEPGKSVEKDLVTDCTQRIIDNLEQVRDKGLQPISAGFVEAVVEEVRTRGVGVGRTQDHVLMDVRDSLYKVLTTLNTALSHGSLGPAIRRGIEDSILDLKLQVRTSVHRG